MSASRLGGSCVQGFTALLAVWLVAKTASGWAGDGDLAATAATGARGAVATGASLASEAGLAALQRGGNAVDAAIAAALTLGVVDGNNSGLGGGCFLLIQRPDGRVVAIDGREMAPAAAQEDMFLRDGVADPESSRTGALAVGVPGALAAYEYAARHFGRRPLREALESAAALAESGFVVDDRYAARLRETARDLARFDDTRRIFLRPDGTPWVKGDRLRQPELAASYRAIAREGSHWFYRGRFATATEAWMHDHGGLVTARDFARYRIRMREPIRTTYRDCEIIGFPPPSSGGVHVAQILNLLERFDLAAMGVGSADFIQVTTEAMKLAFADRAYWLGDPDFTTVPRGLVAKAYAAKIGAAIRTDAAQAVADHDDPGTAAGAFGRHTTHFSTADAAGWWVAATATLNTTFGAKVVVPGTGIMLNNQMDDFAAQPGATNYFGLVGARANAVAPGKRPLSSMSPTLVRRNGKPVLAVGASGGPTIISQTVLAIVNTIDFRMDAASALAQPRFHHQWRPDVLQVEPGVPEEVRAELVRRGQHVAPIKVLAATQAVAKAPGTTNFIAVADPRAGGRGAAW